MRSTSAGSVKLTVRSTTVQPAATVGILPGCGTKRRRLSSGGLGLDGHRLTQPALEHLTVLDPEFLDAARANSVGEANVPTAPRHYAIPEGLTVIVRVPGTPTNHHEPLSRCTSEMSDKTGAMPVPHAGQALIRLYVPPCTGRRENFRLEREKRCLPLAAASLANAHVMCETPRFPDSGRARPLQGENDAGAPSRQPRCVRTSEVKLLPPAPTLPVNLHRLNPHRPLATSKRATARGAVVRERGRRELWRGRRTWRPPASGRRRGPRSIPAPPRCP